LFNVSKQYGRHWALQGVTLTFEAPEIVGLVGPNGAGKTSLLRIIAGLLQPTSGRVTRSAEPHSTRYFAGECSLPPEVTADAWTRLWTGCRNQSLGRRRMGMLSRGTRQQVGLETTLSAVRPAPVLVLLDEPWEGLDPDA